MCWEELRAAMLLIPVKIDYSLLDAESWLVSLIHFSPTQHLSWIDKYLNSTNHTMIVTLQFLVSCINLDDWLKCHFVLIKIILVVFMKLSESHWTMITNVLTASVEYQLSTWNSSALTGCTVLLIARIPQDHHLHPTLCCGHQSQHHHLHHVHCFLISHKNNICQFFYFHG